MPLDQEIDAGPESALPASHRSGPRDDVLTLAAIGIVAYVGCDLLHELAGHGGVCLATGGRPVSLSTIHFQCLGGWQALICAAGILVNLVMGTLLWLIVRRMHTASVHTRYFLWLSMAYNLFTGWGYVVTSSLTNSGDLANAFRGVSTQFQWRGGMALAGALFYFGSVWVTTREVHSFIGSDEGGRLWRLILIPYFAAAFVACAAGAFNSILSMPQVLISAISTTLGAWGFLLLPLFFLFPWIRSIRIPSPVPVTRNLGWIITAAVVVVIFVAVIGPGMKFGGRG
ncbi:MAG: hypothetical protein LAO21_20405 [Acidobacteriia bacterium]|nr:hypothetical protein [Terriglobia bacterium]